MQSQCQMEMHNVRFINPTKSHQPQNGISLIYIWIIRRKEKEEQQQQHRNRLHHINSHARKHTIPTHFFFLLTLPDQMRSVQFKLRFVFCSNTFIFFSAYFFSFDTIVCCECTMTAAAAVLVVVVGFGSLYTMELKCCTVRLNISTDFFLFLRTHAFVSVFDSSATAPKVFGAIHSRLYY